jgi:hypothetical protein
MISKAVRGRGFSGCISYICEKSNAVRTLNIASENWKSAAREMRSVASLNRTEKSVYHHWLSFHPSENMTDEMMFQAASSMIQKLGLSDHQHVCAIHKDREHHHIHIVSNLVNFDGKAVKLSHDFRSRPVFAREIETEMGLKAFERKQREQKEQFPPQKVEAIRAAARTGSRAEIDRVLIELGVTMSEKSSRSRAITYTFIDEKTGAKIAGSRIDPSLSSPSKMSAKARASDGLWQRYEEAKSQHPTIDEREQKARLEMLKKRHQSERKSVRSEQFEIKKEMLRDARKLRLPEADLDAIKSVCAARLAKQIELLGIRQRAERKAADSRFPGFKEWLRAEAKSDLGAAIRLSAMGEEQSEALPTLEGTSFEINGDGSVDFRDEQGRLLFTNTTSGVRFIQHDDYQLRERAVIAGLRVEQAHGMSFEFGSDPRVRKEIIAIAGKHGLRLPTLSKAEEEDWKTARTAKPAAPAPQPSASNAAPEKAQDWQPAWTEAIKLAVNASANTHELVTQLSKAGIVIEEVKRANGSSGIAFLRDGLRVTGSSLDRDLSIKNIKQTLDDNRHRRLVNKIDDNEAGQDIDADLDFEIMKNEMLSQKSPGAKFFGRIASAARRRAPLIESAKFASMAALLSQDRRNFALSNKAQKALTTEDIEREIMSLFRSPSRPKLYTFDFQKQIHAWASKGLLTAQANLATQQRETMNVGRSNEGR